MSSDPKPSDFIIFKNPDRTAGPSDSDCPQIFLTVDALEM
jgi:hypothetical protein